MPFSSRALDEHQAALTKGMLARGDPQHDIAAYFGVNGGRVADVKTGRKHPHIAAAPLADLPPIPRTGRFIDPKAPVDQQFTMLVAMIENPPDTSRVITFVPELCEKIIDPEGEINKHNRKQRPKDIARYAEYMRTGRWSLNGDTIVFSVTGRLLNGQHRLKACIQAGVSFRTHVVFGIDDDAFDVFDDGRKRSGSDAFHVAGVVNSSITAPATRWLQILNDPEHDRSVTFDNRGLLQLFLALPTKDRDLLVAMTTEALSIRKSGVKVVPAQLAAMLYKFKKSDLRKAQRFIDDLKSSRRKGAVAALLRKINKALDKKRRHEFEIMGLVVETWNTYPNTTARAFVYDVHNKDPFPEIL
jgi:hypothetical protein